MIILGAVGVAACAIPFAFAAPFLWLVYLVPLAIIAWVLWTRTTADAEAVTTRRLTGTRRVPWSQISSLRLAKVDNPAKARVSAVLTGGAELPLPAVRVRDLPRLAAASGGRLPDPTRSDHTPSDPVPADPTPSDPMPADATLSDPTLSDPTLSDPARIYPSET